MCGIAGFIDFKANSSEGVLKRMTTTLKHRGPDGDGHFFHHSEGFQIGLGHRRLAIVDLTDTGRQPMQFNDLHIAFNGEIYNYLEIKSTLESIGHTFKSHSDTEVILHAYSQWGTNCVNRFIGMFAIVIFDEKNQEVICFRDRAGVKPFFYYSDSNVFIFGSELKALHEHPSFAKELNSNAVAAFLQYGNIPSPHCIFNDTFKLMPGHFLKINLSSQKHELHRYWNVYDAYNAPKLNISYEEAKEQTKTLLYSAFNYRMIADVPVGVFLSGGFDSSIVTAILQSDRTEKLKTFTIGVPDIGLNEAPYAKDIAAYLGTEHTEINCTENEVLDFIKELPYYYDEPFADSSAIPTSLVSKIAREQVTVALSADGGDEIFAGYNRYDYLLRYRKKLDKTPAFMRKGMVGIMNNISADRIPYFKNKYNFHNRYEKMKGILADPSDENVMLSLSQQFTDAQMKAIMSKDPVKLKTAYINSELSEENYSPLSYMMAVDFQTYLVDDILQKVDRATMSASLEGREPFLDQRIIEFAATLPDHYKYQDGIKKRILKDLTYSYLPKNLMDRPKMGFAIPIGKWLQEDLKPLVEEYCAESKLNDHGLFNTKEIVKILDAFYSGKKEYDFKVWYLLMFQMWYNRWMK